LTFTAPTASLDHALQGRAAGVQVTTIDGAPGSEATIRIRGGNSITAGNEPLYVIDGFIGGGSLSSINPNDIESIEILKDASSTAIYGARGANGVILITTKRGKAGETIANVKTGIGWQVLPEKINVQNASEYAEYLNKLTPGLWDLNNLPGGDTDWQEVMFHAALVTDNQISISGGTEKTQFYYSGGYFKQDGILLGNDFSRYSMRLNFDHQISKAFKTGTNLSLSHSLRNNPIQATGDNAANEGSIKSVIRSDPMKPVYNEDGSYCIENVGIELRGGGNLLADTEMLTNKTTTNRIFINNYIEAEIMEGLNIRSTFGGDFEFGGTNYFSPAYRPWNIINDRLGQARINQSNVIILLNENTIDYKNEFGNHSLEVLAGYTVQKSQTENSGISADEIPNDAVTFYAVQLAPIESTSIKSGYSEFSMASLLARVNYSYSRKYLFTASVRRDGSSRLGANNKYAVFPSVAIAWKVSEESFMQNVDAIYDLKIRASYGLTGNQGISPFSTLPVLGSGGTVIMNGVPTASLQQSSLSNPSIKWETTRQFDLGVDVSLFQGRLSAVLDFYYKRTKDLLLNVEVPYFTGFSSQLQNIGEVQNTGVDLSINSVNINNKDFKWTTSLTISHYQNEVLDLGGKPDIIVSRLNISSSISSKLIVGEPVGTFWGYVFEGIDPATGDAIWKDVNDDGIVDVEDNTIIGSANPKFYGGIQNDFSYKNFDLSFFLQGTYGNDVYYLDGNQINGVELNSYAHLRDKIWTPENPNDALLAGFNSNSMIESSSFMVLNGSFLKLKTLQLGYTLPSGILSGFKQFRVTFTSSNLFLLKDKDYLGFDPDVNHYGKSDVKRGFDALGYPQNRSFIFGLDIVF